jgi:hypothetical protein
MSPPDNVFNINSTRSATEHNERVINLSDQFHIDASVSGSESGLVNLLLGSFFNGSAPKNIIFPKDGFGSNFLRNSPQVLEALSNWKNTADANGNKLSFLEGRAGTPSLLSSLSNDNFKLQDFIGSVDYNISVKNEILTLIMTNVTSLTSGTLGKEAFPSSWWPSSIIQGPYNNAFSNFSQTFTLTFDVNKL